MTSKECNNNSFHFFAIAFIAILIFNCRDYYEHRNFKWTIYNATDSLANTVKLDYSFLWRGIDTSGLQSVNIGFDSLHIFKSYIYSQGEENWIKTFFDTSTIEFILYKDNDTILDTSFTVGNLEFDDNWCNYLDLFINTNL